MLKYWIWVRFDSDSIPIRFRFDSDSNRLRIRSDSGQNSHSTKRPSARPSIVQRPTLGSNFAKFRKKRNFDHFY